MFDLKIIQDFFFKITLLLFIRFVFKIHLNVIIKIVNIISLLIGIIAFLVMKRKFSL